MYKCKWRKKTILFYPVTISLPKCIFSLRPWLNMHHYRHILRKMIPRGFLDSQGFVASEWTSTLKALCCRVGFSQMDRSKDALRI